MKDNFSSVYQVRSICHDHLFNMAAGEQTINKQHSYVWILEVCLCRIIILCILTISDLRMPSYCSVINCGNRRLRNNVKFYRIPAVVNFPHKIRLNELSKLRREKWISAIKRTDLVGTKAIYAAVCSQHFITGKPARLEDDLNPDWVPSVKMGYKKESSVVNIRCEGAILECLATEEFETVHLKDEESDCEIVETTPGMVDVPDYIDPNSLNTLINEPTESLPPVIQNIVSKLSNDEEFDRECDKFYKANLEMDVENVQVDVVKVLSSTLRSSQPVKTISLSAEIDDIRTTKDLPGICSLCGDSNDHVELLLTHLKDGHQLKQGLFVCPFCDYTSVKYEVVMKHTTKVHKLVSEQHKCDQCDYKTFRGDLYNRHLNQHLKEKIYSCDHCNYKTINVMNFKKHLSSKHTKETEYKCQFCDFTSTHQGVVRKHETAKHTSEKVFSCDKCTYKTTLAHTLKRHQQRYCKNKNIKNSNAFTYVCVHCNFTTEKVSALEDHTLLKHPKKEILFCNVCDFSTIESAELTEHARTHLKNEPSDSEN